MLGGIRVGVKTGGLGLRSRARRATFAGALGLFIVLMALGVLPTLTRSQDQEVAGSIHAAPRLEIPAKPGVLRLSFVGDILLGGTVGELIDRDREGPLAPWLDVKDMLSTADLTCGNLECAVGTTGTPVPGKTWTFRAAPKSLEGLKAAGFDVVSFANNHALDYGAECLLEGVELVRNAGIGAIGAGANDKAARQPYILEKNGLKVGILATTVVWPDESWVASKDSPGLATDGWNWYPGIVASIKELSLSVDVVVVVVHWGEERATEPVDWIMPIAKAMKDAGAHAVIGSHPHVLEGIYYDGRKVTAYSLGNFVFSTRPDIPACQVGVILNLTVSKGKVEDVTVIPSRILWGKTVPCEGADRDGVLQTMSSLSRPLGTDVGSRGDVVPLIFTDMNNHWARFAVGRLAVRGSITGYEDGTFLPYHRCPKEEFAAMFARGIASETDIGAAPEREGFILCPKDSWAYPYLSFMASKSIISPSDPNWVAGKPCTRLDACICLWKHAGSPGASVPASPQPPPHPETKDLDAMGVAAVTWAMSTGILRGYPDGSLKLADSISRAEVAEMLLRYLEGQGR